MQKIFQDRADLRSILFILLHLFLLGGQWGDYFRDSFLYGMSFFLAFLSCVINHNHQHLPIFRIPFFNRVLGVLISLGIGQPASAIVPMHLLNHHRYNNQAEDLVRASLFQCRWNLITLLLFPFVALSGFLKKKHEVLNQWKQLDPVAHHQLKLERIVLYSLLGGTFFLRPQETLLYFCAPWIFGQWGIIAMNHIQHYHCEPNSTYQHSINFTGNFLNWWTFNNGYHTAHHLNPEIHWSQLPHVHQSIASEIDPCLLRKSLLWTLICEYFFHWGVPSKKNSREIRHG